MARHVGTAARAAISQKPIPFVCASCGGDMQMVITKRTAMGDHGFTHCPKCDTDKEAD